MRCSAKSGSVRNSSARAREAEAKTFNKNKEKGRAGGPNFEPEHPLARFDILHATNQDKIHE